MKEFPEKWIAYKTHACSWRYHTCVEGKSRPPSLQSQTEKAVLASMWATRPRELLKFTGTSGFPTLLDFESLEHAGYVIAGDKGIFVTFSASNTASILVWGLWEYNCMSVDFPYNWEPWKCRKPTALRKPFACSRNMWLFCLQRVKFRCIWKSITGKIIARPSVLCWCNLEPPKPAWIHSQDVWLCS